MFRRLNPQPTRLERLFPFVGKQFKATFASMPSHTGYTAWTIPHHPNIRVKEALLFGSNFTGTFTILNPRHFENNKNELRVQYIEMQSEWVTNLIVPTLERAALHEAIINNTLKVKTADEKAFTHHVHQTVKKAKPLIDEKNREVHQFDKEAVTLARESMSRVLTYGPSSTYPIDATTVKVLYTLYKNKKNGCYVSSSSEDKIGDLTLKIVTNTLKRDHRKAISRQIVSDVLSQEFAAGEKEPLADVDVQNAFSIQMLGGSATGKTTLLRDILHHYERTYHISPEKVSFICTDWTRLPLLNDPDLGDDHTVHGELTQDEASIINADTLRRRQEIIAAQGRTPHILIEQIYVNKDELNLIGAGTRLRVYVTFCDPEKALENNFDRYNKYKQRLTARESVLRSPQLASNKMPDILNTSEKNVIVEFHNTQLRMDNSPELSNTIRPAAILNKSLNRLYVLDIASFLEFIKRGEINPHATSRATLFSPKSTVTDCVNKLKEQYGKLDILFVDPCAINVDYHNLDTNVYASHTPNDGLHIKKQDILEKVIKSNAEKTLFTVLSGKELTKVSENSNSEHITKSYSLTSP